ncbi:Crp/Fnr family transcriptional regulator [Candidatus Saccharibacteria bacterium]|nr:MAG: Crp/Fnr family transcriptional regulator [Candidatus Saccharibacteria bacterium]TXG76084.1 MAG: Crp/Fnr family transcriptional regulator [Patescibacteria group bacterium]
MDNATPAELTRFFEKYPTRKLKKGWPLLYQGEVPRSAFVVKSGMIKVYDINANGEEKVITFTDTDGFLPMEWLFDKSPVSLYYCDAFTDAEVYAIPRQLLFDMLHSNEEMLQFTLRRYINLYVGATLHISALEQTKAAEKLLRILQWLSLRFGKEIRPGTFKVDIRLTHQDLASMIGMTRETTAVELGKLRTQKVISYQNQRYILNAEKMRQILGEDELRDLTI